MRTKSITLILLFGLLAAAGAPAAAVKVAQDPDETLRPNVPADFDPAAHGLARDPLVIDDLGFAMHPPRGAVAIPQRTGGQYALTIMDRANPPAWSISVQHLVATTSETTAASQIETHLAALREAERPHRVLRNEPISIGGSRGQLCYIEQTRPRGEKIVNGWLVLPVGQGLHLVFSLMATAEDFPSLRPAFDSAFETLSLRTAEEVADLRLTRIDAAREFLGTLSPERLRELVGLQRWSRIYQPSPSGEAETEIGYSFLEVREGRRGELNPNRPESSYSPAEQQQGLLVRLQGRIIGDAKRNVFLDSQSVYWMAWDMSEEAWDVKATERHGQAALTQAETGIRTAPSLGDPRPLLTVIRDSTRTQQQVTNEWAVPDVYLSQALGTVLGRLLATSSSSRTHQEFAWYFYNYSQAIPQLTQRTDRWAPADDGSNNWVLRTQLSIDSPAILSYYGPDGRFVRTVRAEGVITEPTTPDELRFIWERSGLPLGRTPSRSR